VATTTSTTTMPPATTPPTTLPTTTSTTTAPTTTAASTTTSTSAPATTSTTLPSWWREATAEDPLRVWVIGDSLAGPVGNALVRLKEGLPVVVTMDHEPGTGLASPGYFDWPALVAERLPAVAPDVVVCMLGANDGQALYPGGGPVEFGTAEWDAGYSALVGEFMDQLAAGSSRVYWVGVPVMAGPNYDAKVRVINGILRFEAGLRLDVRFIDAYSLFEGDGGGFAPRLPDATGALVTVRDSDGIHFTGAGAERMARRILEVLQADWRLAAG
jgi:hypothetical protein